MKLSVLPILIQKEIFASMGLSELILTSFCSTKLKNQIAHWIGRQFASIGIVFYKNGNDRSEILSVNEKEKVQLFCIKKEHEGDGWSRTRILEEDAEICFPADHQHPFLIHNNCPFLLAKLQHYIYDFLGPSIEYHLDSYGFHVPMLNHISHSELTLQDPTTASAELEQFLTISPNHEHLFISSARNSGIEQNQRLKNIAYVEIAGGGFPCAEVLIGFQGRCLKTYHGVLQTNTVVEFMRTWQMNQGYQNLRWLECSFLETELNPIYILGQFNFMRLDAPPAFQYRRRRGVGDARHITEEYRTSSYIKRDIDGHVAYVTLNTNVFRFAVWDKTIQQIEEMADGVV